MLLIPAIESEYEASPDVFIDLGLPRYTLFFAVVAREVRTCLPFAMKILDRTGKNAQKFYPGLLYFGNRFRRTSLLHMPSAA